MGMSPLRSRTYRRCANIARPTSGEIAVLRYIGTLVRLNFACSIPGIECTQEGKPMWKADYET